MASVAACMALWERAHRQQRALLRAVGLPEIDQMTGQQFEHRLRLLFEDRGFYVRETATTGDFGADLILDRVNGRTIVQAKRHSKPVGVKSVQEAHAAMSYYASDRAMVVTNSTFAPQAHQLAQRCGVTLWDRAALTTGLMDEARRAAHPKPSAWSQLDRLLQLAQIRAKLLVQRAVRLGR